jgi:penicillin V acylase-like amidase (Ntn superfamily)
MFFNSKKWILPLAAFILSLMQGSDSEACSSFLYSDSNTSIVGKNLDMGPGHGLIIVNKRNLAKVGLAQGNHLAKWISKYGSIIFNQVS